MAAGKRARHHNRGQRQSYRRRYHHRSRRIHDNLGDGPASLDHVLGDARLSDLKPQLEQFAVDARRTPKQILRAHLPDQRAQFRLDRRSPSPAT